MFGSGLRSPCLPATYQHASATLTSLARHISPSLNMPATLKRASNIHVLSFFNDVIASLCQRAARGSEVHLTAGCEMHARLRDATARLQDAMLCDRDETQETQGFWTQAVRRTGCKTRGYDNTHNWLRETERQGCVSSKAASRMAATLIAATVRDAKLRHLDQ